MKRGFVHILILLFLALQWPHIHTHSKGPVQDWPESQESLNESCQQCDWRQTSFDVPSELVAHTVSEGWQHSLTLAPYSSPALLGYDFGLENKGPPLVI